ncbi:MAG: ABC transporter substrate-binding protein [Oscillospiraceae bacterium]|nr:ABC transporter substrate-binding protein [Oscillospiraceae bacterium]
MKKLVSILLSISVLGCVAVGCSNQDSNSQNDVSEGNAASISTDSTSSEENEAISTNESIEADVAEEYASVTIDNFNSVTEYTEKPSSVITLTLNSAEIIAALGESDSIVGIARNNNVVDDVLPEYLNSLSNCAFPDEINTGIPTLEGMLGFSPDLIVANSYYFNVPVFGTAEDYTNNNANLYIPEGTYVQNSTIENTYNDIRNLGKIFGKEDKAEELVNGMEERIAAVTEKVSGRDTVRVMAFDSTNEDMLNVAGGTGLEQNLIELAGGENIFSDVEKQFGAVSYEEIISRDPEIIVIHEYTIDETDAQTKIDLIKNSPDLANVSAVKNDRIIIVPLFNINPGLQNVDFVETLAKELHSEVFE